MINPVKVSLLELLIKAAKVVVELIEEEIRRRRRKCPKKEAL